MSGKRRRENEVLVGGLPGSKASNPILKEKLSQWNPTKVHCNYDNSSQFNGSATISFSCEEDSLKFINALDKHEIQIEGKHLYKKSRFHSKNFQYLKPIKESPKLVKDIPNGALEDQLKLWIRGKIDVQNNKRNDIEKKGEIYDDKEFYRDILDQKFVCLEFSVAYSDEKISIPCEIGCCRFRLRSGQEGGEEAKIHYNIYPGDITKYQEKVAEFTKVHGITDGYDLEEPYSKYYNKIYSDFIKILKDTPKIIDTHVVFSRDVQTTQNCLQWLHNQTKEKLTEIVKVCDIQVLAKIFFYDINKKSNTDTLDFQKWQTEIHNPNKAGQCTYHKRKSDFFQCSLRNSRLSAAFLRKIIMEAKILNPGFVSLALWEEDWGKDCSLSFKEDAISGNKPTVTDILMMESRPPFDLFTMTDMVHEMKNKVNDMESKLDQVPGLLSTLQLFEKNLIELVNEKKSLNEEKERYQLAYQDVQARLISFKNSNTEQPVDYYLEMDRALKFCNKLSEEMNIMKAKMVQYDQQMYFLYHENLSLKNTVEEKEKQIFSLQQSPRIDFLKSENKKLKQQLSKYQENSEMVLANLHELQREVTSHKNSNEALQKEMKNQKINFNKMYNDLKEKKVEESPTLGIEKLELETELAGLKIQMDQLESLLQSKNEKIEELERITVHTKEHVKIKKEFMEETDRQKKYLEKRLKHSEETFKNRKNVIRELVQTTEPASRTQKAPHEPLAFRTPVLYKQYKPSKKPVQATVISSDPQVLLKSNKLLEKFLSTPLSTLPIAVFTVPHDDLRPGLSYQDGVKAIKPIKKNQIIIEYIGVLKTQTQFNEEFISKPLEFIQRENYLYYFNDDGKKKNKTEIILDAFGDTNMAALINDCRLNPFHPNQKKRHKFYKPANVCFLEYQTEKEGIKRVFVQAKQNIMEGEELLLDYGESYWDTIRFDSNVKQEFEKIWKALIGLMQA